MEPLRAAIFDFDGTLVDSEILWVEAIEGALRQRGVPITRQAAVRLVYGHAWPDIFRQIEKDYPGAYPSRQAMEAVTVPRFQELSRRRDIRIVPSIELLRRLSARLPVAVVSGSTRARVGESLASLGLDGRVRFFLGCEDVPAGKPDPAGFVLAARRLGVPASSCLVFEDSGAGVAAAKAAGMRCVALVRDPSLGQDVAGADLVVSSLDGFDVERFWAGACGGGIGGSAGQAP